MTRLPRRRLALYLIGAAWISHGFTIMHNPGPRVMDQAIIYENWPLQLRVLIWVLAGVLALGLAANGTARAQALGWALAIVPPTIRVVSYLWSVLMWLIPGAPGGEPLSLAYVGFWGSLVGIVWLVSRWAEPTPQPAAPEDV